tara:strand:+ start:55 stop:597 length:543 start_codon:yes stop_codon:yes gene_type:complete
MNIPSLERYLNSFGKQIVKQAKENLSKADKKGALENSIDFFVIKKGGSITVRFKMNSYGAFVDKGVSGTDKKRSYKDYKGKTKSSPFKYKAKGPPIDILSKWVKRKGIKGHGMKKGRSKNTGQYISGLAIYISRKIKVRGIQGISFFQKPLMLGMKQFSSKFGKAIADDIVNSLRQQKIA